MTGILSAVEEYVRTVDRVSGMNVAISGQVRREEILKADRIVSHLSLA